MRGAMSRTRGDVGPERTQRVCRCLARATLKRMTGTRDLPARTAYVVWHHVGKEHERPYARSIQRNASEVVDQYLQAKIDALVDRGPNAFWYDGLLVEISEREGARRSLTVYDGEQGLQVSRGNKGDDWLIDIVAVVQHSADVYVARDLFIDIRISPSGTPEVLDLDEFAEALESAVIDIATAAISLRSLDVALGRIQRAELPIPTASLLWETYCA